MKMKRYLLLFLLPAVLAIASCAPIESPRSPEKPLITLDREEPVYKVRAGEPLDIAPSVANAGANPSYRWTIDGSVVGTEASFRFVGTEAGSVYITFEVVASHGQADIEIRVDVAAPKTPVVTLVVPPEGFLIAAGTALELKPSVSSATKATYLWEVGGKPVSTEKNHTFTSAETGEYTVRFTATNADGSDHAEFAVRVAAEAQMPFAWMFEHDTFNASLGRTVFIRPYHVANAFDAVYTWKVDGTEVETPPVETKYAGAEPASIFAFTPETEGTYTVEVTMTNKYTTASKTFTVNCCPAEGAYKRPAGGSATPECDKVYEFTAAPGQFINEGYAAATMAEACARAEERLAENTPVSLGAFGGYIVAGFDHSVTNSGGYDICVLGNASTGGSEPGVVWVMQDENGDGLPNDTWYELKGSEYGRGDTRLDYAVTYYRPSGNAKPVAWIDNDGGSGLVNHMTAYHPQAYYPQWVEGDSYTLVGRRLRSRVEMISGSNWKAGDYGWGYADNFSTVDGADSGSGAYVSANRFRISDAVRYDGSPAGLGYVDFVKVQTGVQAQAGWLGEISTEVLGIYDYNLMK